MGDLKVLKVSRDCEGRGSRVLVLALALGYKEIWGIVS